MTGALQRKDLFCGYRSVICLWCLALCTLLYLYSGCIGEIMPDPEPTPDPPPVIYGFQTLQDGEWQDTESGTIGAVIGVVGKFFGEVAADIRVYYNGIPAEILRIEEYAVPGDEDEVDETLKRIVTVVPEGATTGPVVVDRNGFRSDAVIFSVILVTHYNVTDILLDPGGDGNPVSGVWAGTMGGGVIHFDGDLENLKKGNFTCYTISQGMFSNRVNSLLKDGAGRLLVATVDGGLSIKTETGFVTYAKENPTKY